MPISASPATARIARRFVKKRIPTSLAVNFTSPRFSDRHRFHGHLWRDRLGSMWPCRNHWARVGRALADGSVAASWVVHAPTHEGLLEFRRGRGISVAGAPERGAVIQQARELVELARWHGCRVDELVE